MNGLRISGALNAGIEDFDTERGHRTLRIVREGGKHVTVPLAPRTACALDLYIGDRSSGPIFVTGERRRMDRGAADRIVKRLARRAGIGKQISPHSLRHITLTTLALDAGVALGDVQAAASHAGPRTTIRYDRGRQSWTDTPRTSSSPPSSPACRPSGRRRSGPRMLAWRERRRCARISRHGAGGGVGGGHVEGLRAPSTGRGRAGGGFFMEMSLGVVVGGDG